MSLVERALQKIQASDRAKRVAVPAPSVVVGEVVARSELRPTPAPKPAPPINPNRVVKVDRDALRSSGLLPPVEQEKMLADQYRAIKRPLIRAAFEQPQSEGPPPQLIMIASALPGDGKTFTGVNLAMSMAREADHSVVLVDGDVVKPHLSKLFGIDREPGLFDVLADETLDIRSVILPTDIPGLSLVPAGTASDTATEMLASARMSHVMQQLVSWNPSGLVLFDSLPILITSEARALSSLMGQIVMVIKAGGTPQQAVADSLEALGKDKKVWLVLNQAETSGPLGYYYGSQYGYRGYADPSAAAPRAPDSA
ncbi:MAG TPA: CpsD/CapB family tyrosine-protein kinase [Steroidobacteraceae bacterium]